HRQLPIPGVAGVRVRAPGEVRPGRRGRDGRRRRECRPAGPVGGRTGRRDRRRADAARLQPVVLRVHRGHRPGSRPAPAVAAAGRREITVDEPSMSCYAYCEDPRRFVDIFNRTVEPVVGKCRLGTHLCFGNFKGRAVGPRRYAPMFPAFLDMTVDEVHVEMASREFAEIELIAEIAKRRDVAVGVIDVKSYYIETPKDVAERVRLSLKHAPPDRLSFAPDCGLSQ